MIKFTVLGLANFGGLLGFFIASHFLKVENTFVKIPSTNEKTKRELSGKKMGLGFGIFVLALAFVCFLMFGFNPYASFFSLIFVFLIVLLFSLPVVGTILLFMYGYQKNKQKTSFIAAFSLFCFIFILFIHIILIIL